MASKTSKGNDRVVDGWSGRRVDFSEFTRRIAARKAELGLPDPPRNAGATRTESKYALLKAIKDAGGEW